MQTNVMVGTRKGAWIYTSDDDRRKWAVSQPIMPGYTVHHMVADTRHDPVRILAAANHWAWGPGVAYSDDGGKTWTETRKGLKFPEDMGIAVQNVWNIRPGHPGQPGVVYVGTQPAGLFKSEDWGETWAPVDSINRHEYRPFFTDSGGGASALHSIEIDPRDASHWYVSIATGGTFETHDDGQNWVLCSHRAIPTNPLQKKMWEDFAERYPQLQEQFADFPVPPGVDPAAVNEMHKMRIDVTNPDRIWAQTHVGVFRSDDGGDSWHDVTVGLPSFHGFPIGVSKDGDGAAYVVPLEFESDNFRVVRSQFAVWRTRDGGKTWQQLCEGLPGPDDYQSVYREAMDTDERGGVYLGTTNGQVYGTRNGGDSWDRLPGTLPPILAVSAASW